MLKILKYIVYKTIDVLNILCIYWQDTLFTLLNDMKFSVLKYNNIY